MSDAENSNFDEIIYKQLKVIAYKLMSKERQNHTLSPTDLVHEAYLKLSKKQPKTIDNAGYLFILARQMRRLLVDYGRSKSSTKNGGKQNKLLYSDTLGINESYMADFSIISEAIDELELINERCAQAIDLYYFTGISREETSITLNISLPTLERDLHFAKAYIMQYVDENNQIG